MWRFECPICKKMVEKPEMGREDVKRIATTSIYCPHCNGRLYVQESGATVDLAGALVNFFKQVGGLTISREEALANYYEDIDEKELDCSEEEVWKLPYSNVKEEMDEDDFLDWSDVPDIC
jgi:DNA-directed RNA polymerase subunit RPC12/RpoP